MSLERQKTHISPKSYGILEKQKIGLKTIREIKNKTQNLLEQNNNNMMTTNNIKKLSSFDSPTNNQMNQSITSLANNSFSANTFYNSVHQARADNALNKSTLMISKDNQKLEDKIKELQLNLSSLPTSFCRPKSKSNYS